MLNVQLKLKNLPKHLKLNYNNFGTNGQVIIGIAIILSPSSEIKN